MLSKTSFALLLFFPFSIFALECSLGDLETSDTLDVYLAGRLVGVLNHTAVYSDASKTINVTIDLVIRNTVDSINPSNADLSLHETRWYDTHGFLVKARQELKGASGLNTWDLQKRAGAWDYTATAGGAATADTISFVNENLSSACKLIKGVRGKTLRKHDTWNDTAFELISRSRVISKITCVSVDSIRGCWTLESVDNISGRAEKQVIDSRGATIEQSIEGMYVAKAVHTGQAASAITAPPAAGLPADRRTVSDMFPIAPAHEPRPGEPITVLPADSSVMLDNSVSPFFIVRVGRWILNPLPSRCAASSDPVSGSAFSRWLAPAISIQSDHPDIVKLSKRICGGERDPCARIAACSHYVYASLKKRPTATFSNALETLHAGFGDCGEHAVLLAAMLRAGGIPARVVLGLLYVKSKQAYFYHAQVMAWAGQWVFADPTWDVFPAHDGFVPLIIDDTGSKALLLSRVIGRIRIE